MREGGRGRDSVVEHPPSMQEALGWIPSSWGSQGGYTTHDSQKLIVKRHWWGYHLSHGQYSCQRIQCPCLPVQVTLEWGFHIYPPPSRPLNISSKCDLFALWSLFPELILISWTSLSLLPGTGELRRSSLISSEIQSCVADHRDTSGPMCCDCVNTTEPTTDVQPAAHLGSRIEAAAPSPTIWTACPRSHTLSDCNNNICLSKHLSPEK